MRHLDRRTEAELEAKLKRDRQEQHLEKRKPRAEASGAPVRRGSWQGIVEQRILDGMERGAFDNLKGAGQPLNLDDDRFVPEEFKMAYRLLRSHDLAPLWVSLNREIREDIARLDRYRVFVHARWTAMSVVEHEHRRAEYLKRIRDINDKILSYNIVAPTQAHFAMLLEQQMLDAYDHPALC